MAEQKEYLKEGDGFIEITLSRPAKIHGAETRVLRMREPTVRDQLAASEKSGSDAAKEIALMANLCEIAPSDIEALPIRDYKRLQAAFVRFTD